jgi:hypothetical protein
VNNEEEEEEKEDEGEENKKRQIRKKVCTSLIAPFRSPAPVLHYEQEGSSSRNSQLKIQKQ